MTVPEGFVEIGYREKLALDTIGRAVHSEYLPMPPDTSEWRRYKRISSSNEFPAEGIEEVRFEHFFAAAEDVAIAKTLIGCQIDLPEEITFGAEVRLKHPINYIATVIKLDNEEG
jgi:hypothetical protein